MHEGFNIINKSVSGMTPFIIIKSEARKVNRTELLDKVKVDKGLFFFLFV